MQADLAVAEDHDALHGAADGLDLADGALALDHLGAQLLRIVVVALVRRRRGGFVDVVRGEGALAGANVHQDFGQIDVVEEERDALDRFSGEGDAFRQLERLHGCIVVGSTAPRTGVHGSRWTAPNTGVRSSHVKLHRGHASFQRAPGQSGCHTAAVDLQRGRRGKRSTWAEERRTRKRNETKAAVLKEISHRRVLEGEHVREVSSGTNCHPCLACRSLARSCVLAFHRSNVLSSDSSHAIRLHFTSPDPSASTQLTQPLANSLTNRRREGGWKRGRRRTTTIPSQRRRRRN